MLPKGVIQSRANQLVRELNAIEDRTNDARSRILEERRNKDISTSTLDKENISGSKATACARQNVSMDSDRLSLEDGDASDDEVIIIEPPSADIPANCVASLLQVDDKKRSSTAERETGLLDLHASPEKKHRVS